MIADNKKQMSEANNFVSDALSLLTSLNKNTGKEMNDEESQKFLEGIDDFSKSFIYFRESYEKKSTNIHHLAILLEDIRKVVDNGNEDYAVDNITHQEGLEILETIINDSVIKLGDMDAYLIEAEKEEHENKRMEAIERIFISTKLEIEGADKTFNEISKVIKQDMSIVHAEMEHMDKQQSVLENIAKEFKEQCDKVVSMGDGLEKEFKDWKIVSNTEIEKAFNETIENIKAKKIEATESKNNDLIVIEEAWKKILTDIEVKSAATINNVESLNNESKSLLKREGFKQFLVYGGTVLAGLNFFLLLAMLIIK